MKKYHESNQCSYCGICETADPSTPEGWFSVDEDGDKICDGCKCKACDHAGIVTPATKRISVTMPDGSVPIIQQFCDDCFAEYERRMPAIYHCNRCGHRWAGGDPPPKRCANPECRSPYWNKKRKYK